MSTAIDTGTAPNTSPILSAAVAACARIAPTWPLDQMIAVNPFWEMRDLTTAQVSARLATLSQAQMLAPQALADSVHALPISRSQLLQAQQEENAAGATENSNNTPGHWLNVSDLLDAQRDLVHRMAWHDEIIDQIGRFCATAFDLNEPKNFAPGELYASWLNTIRADQGVATLMGERTIAQRFDNLPSTPAQLIHTAIGEMRVEDTVVEHYCHALLLDINGWCAWAAYLRWQDRLVGDEADLLPDLLAIRLAWDLVLWRHVKSTDQTSFDRIRFRWQLQQGQLPVLLRAHTHHQRPAWVRQRAAELAYQSLLAQQLQTPRTELPRPELQAVFCIDVRSEVLRRHLEAQSVSVQTSGFAGFFGLPISFQSAGSAIETPRLPGLLAPVLKVVEKDDANKSATQRRRKARWNELGESAPAMFGLVETLGLGYAAKLLGAGLRPAAARRSEPEAEGELVLYGENGELSLGEQVDLVAGVLQSMGLIRNYADTTLLVAHGSSSCNNPHATSLDCGACGGASGEINARLLAAMLNNPQIRTGLAERGLAIPATSKFVAALHDTTTETVHPLGDEPLDARHTQWLRSASDAALAERAGLSDPTPRSAEDLRGAAERRARDWSETRPEWGLAGNASFIAAPRSRTREVDLAGRAFLHDYCWQDDPEFKVLELILTAPMVVANWINTQYNASVADSRRYGSGNKTLHNVVGGRLGVLEGNGGDLRIGLSRQSLHDGQRWMHTPLRLSAYIDAPREAILDVYHRHENVRQLVDNDWLYLFRLTEEEPERLHNSQWMPWDTAIERIEPDPASS